MFVRNLLQAGDHVTVVPSGIRVTLQYSERGSLEAVYVGHEDQVLHPEMLTPILKSGDVPVHLPITKGTSYVFGCLYSSDVYLVEGKFHNSVESHYVSEYLKDPTRFHFFAGHLQSYAVGMNTPMAVQRWLKTIGFHTLPSYLVPANMTEDRFDVMLNLESYPFIYPRIMSYIIFRKGNYEFVNTNVRQLVVKHIEKIVSYDGYILADIQSHDLGSVSVSYSDVVNYNIHEGYIILVNDENKIINCTPPAGVKSEPYPPKVSCDYCGKLILVPRNSSRFTCDEPNCVSTMYPRINNMLSKLGLNTIELDRVKEVAAANSNLITLTDVLNLEEYKDLHLVVDAPVLLSAIVPSTILTRVSDWTSLCNRCNNSVDTIKYYLENPDKMMFDLNLEGAVYRRLHQWLQDPSNVADVISVIEHPSISVVSTGKKFDGAPIFRGKSIFLTGAFSHGSIDEVRAILSSYSAQVYDRFNTAVDCVIIGDLHEGVDGKSIQKAKRMSIPIFEESDFFNKYEIDADLAANLI